MKATHEERGRVAIERQKSAGQATRHEAREVSAKAILQNKETAAHLGQAAFLQARLVDDLHSYLNAGKLVHRELNLGKVSLANCLSRARQQKGSVRLQTASGTGQVFFLKGEMAELFLLISGSVRTASLTLSIS